MSARRLLWQSSSKRSATSVSRHRPRAPSAPPPDGPHAVAIGLQRRRQRHAIGLEAASRPARKTRRRSRSRRTGTGGGRSATGRSSQISQMRPMSPCASGVRPRPGSRARMFIDIALRRPVKPECISAQMRARQRARGHVLRPHVLFLELLGQVFADGQAVPDRHFAGQQHRHPAGLRIHRRSCWRCRAGRAGCGLPGTGCRRRSSPPRAASTTTNNSCCR